MSVGQGDATICGFEMAIARGEGSWYLLGELELSLIDLVRVVL